MAENEEGKPAAPDDDWSGVEAVASGVEASLVVGFLESEGIPARIVDKAFRQTPTLDEDLSEVDVAVPTSRLEEARKLLASRDLAFSREKQGEAKVMTDEGAVEIDPNAPPEGGE